MRRTSVRWACGLALSSLLVAAGCGNGSSSPKTPHDQLVAGLAALGDSDVLTTTLKLDTTPAALQGIAQAGGGTLSAKSAQAISSAQLVLETNAGDSKHKSYLVRVDVNGSGLAELRYVDNSLYIQANVPSIVQLANKPDALTEFQKHASQLPPFVAALLSGKWVSISGTTLNAIAGQLGATSSSSGGSASSKFTNDLSRVFKEDVTVTKVGTDSKGDHLKLTGMSRKLYTDLVTAIQNDVPTASTFTKLNPSQVDNRSVTLDAWVKDGVVTEISLDLAQFAPPAKVPAGTHLPLTLTFDKSGDDITAPSGATEVDLTQLGSLFQALQGGSSLGG